MWFWLMQHLLQRPCQCRLCSPALRAWERKLHNHINDVLTALEHGDGLMACTRYLACAGAANASILEDHRSQSWVETVAHTVYEQICLTILPCVKASPVLGVGIDETEGCMHVVASFPYRHTLC